MGAIIPAFSGSDKIRRFFLRSSVVALSIVGVCCQGTSTQPTASSPATASSSATVHNISGQVRDSAGRPLSGARIEIIDGLLAGRLTTTDEEGRFSLAASGPATESVTLQLTKDGYTPVTATVRAPYDLHFTLTALTLIDLEGQYTIAFIPAASCGQLSPSLRTRTYIATVIPRTSQRAYFTVELSGADLDPAYDTFFGAVGSDAARFSVYSWDAFNWWLEDHPIIERLAAGAYVAFMGSAIAPVVTSNVSVSAMFEGSFSYCPAATEPTLTNYPPTCSAPVECKSSQHQLTLSRR